MNVEIQCQLNLQKRCCSIINCSLILVFVGTPITHCSNVMGICVTHCSCTPRLKVFLCDKIDICQTYSWLVCYDHVTKTHWHTWATLSDLSPTPTIHTLQDPAQILCDLIWSHHNANSTTIGSLAWMWRPNKSVRQWCIVLTYPNLMMVFCDNENKHDRYPTVTCSWS